MAASPPAAGAVRLEVEAVVEALRQDAQLDIALGDTQIESRNSVVSDAARTLTHIVSGSENAAKTAIDAGAIEAAIYALRSRPNSEKVQMEASQCLGRLAASCGLFPKRDSSSGSSFADIRRSPLSPGLPPCATASSQSSSSNKTLALHSNAYRLPALGDSLQRVTTSQSVSSEASPAKRVSYSPDPADSQSPAQALQCDPLSPFFRTGRSSASGLASVTHASTHRKSLAADEETLNQSRSAPTLASASSLAVTSPQRLGSTLRRVFSVADLNKS